MPTQVATRIRDGFGAVIDEDWVGVRVTLDGFGPEESEVVLTLALYVCGYVVNDVADRDAADHETPSRDSLRRLAAQIVDGVSDAWAVGGVEEVASFLDLAAESYRGEVGPDSLGGLDGQLVVTLAFLCGGWLLASHRHQDQRWEEYLYDIWSQYLRRW